MYNLLSKIESFCADHPLIVGIVVFFLTLYVLRCIGKLIQRLFDCAVTSIKGRSSIRRGRKGEKIVKKLLRRLNKDEYIALHDIMIPSKNGTTQIDHIVIATRGIFVLETKNYGGTISGNPESRTLFQSFCGSEPKEINNPTYQNYGHALAIRDLFKFTNTAHIFPIVVFGNECILNFMRRTDEICLAEDLINRIEYVRDECFTKEQMISFANELKKKNIKSKRARKAHVIAIQNSL